MKLSTKFDYSKVKSDCENTVNLLVSATAPKIDWKGNRTPVSLIAAVDISSSMAGEKLDYAKKSLMKLIDNLTSGDVLGIILFDHMIELLSEPVPMTQENKDRLKAKVTQLQHRGSTNFSGAMLEALKYANQIKGASRVIMFTDGEPTAGVTDLHQIVELLKSNLGKNTTLTTFGYGDRHDSKFLIQLADLAKGNYAYIKNPDDALVAFAKELGGLLSCYAQNLKFSVTPKEGVELVQVHSDVDVEELEKSVGITVPDLYAEETRHIVIELKLPAHKALPREVSVVEAHLSYTDAQTGKYETLSEKAKISYVKASDVQTTPDKEVANQLTLCQVNNAQKKAADLAASGNIVAAAACFDSLDLSRADISVQNYANTSKGFYANTASYNDHVHDISSSLRSMRTGRGTSTFTSQLYASNSAMDSMVESFKDGEDQNVTLQGGAAGVNVTVGSAAGVTTTQTGGAGGTTQSAQDFLTTFTQNALNLNAGGSTGTLTASTEEKKKSLSKKRDRASW